MASAAMSEEDEHIYTHTTILNKAEEEPTQMLEFGNRRQEYEPTPHKGKLISTTNFSTQF